MIIRDPEDNSPTLLTERQSRDFLRVKKESLLRMIADGVVAPVGWYKHYALFSTHDLAAIAGNLELMVLYDGRLPRVPGSRWRYRRCDQCGDVFAPRGPRDARCSDSCREQFYGREEAE